MIKTLNLTEGQKDNLINATAAEKLAGVNRGHFTYLRGLGKGPTFLRQNGRIFFQVKEVERWVAAEKRLFVETSMVKSK